MDARFHELTNPEKGAQNPRVGFVAWVLLFLSVFAGNYLGLMAWGKFVFSSRSSEGFISQFPVHILLGMFVGWPAVIYYKMRALLPIRCVSFIAAVATNILAASHFRQAFLDVKTPVYAPSITWILVATVLLIIPIIQMEMTAVRAKYLYSEKTGQWLRYYTSKQRLVVDPEKPKPETVEDVLALETVKKKWRDIGDISELGLFLDLIPDGEHYFCASFQNKSRQKFFSPELSRPKTGIVLFRIDWQQAGQLRARFGELKKTRFISMLSARAGSELRLRRRGSK